MKIKFKIIDFFFVLFFFKCCNQKGDFFFKFYIKINVNKWINDMVKYIKFGKKVV